ncbi:MscS Mechanosensitive ion channel [Ferrimonas balearica DSM 9799]|uniref:Small-conductance mechanosensitive channel n=1 Tax=Ferrimonas balearica (strain DSM 9799 / CCM 4581 / KCTC 23876 / PAT) TaxID=550540 RepID=E1STA5_FERBD|nr:mechanosensitive ion channel domain-containing protein [Ferrimonas balearica]ADN77139.1 MscS Mechanosensitive ion channel [Ferrimonas balearica DSM 9799]MBW3139867.1 mechanosensitive ion channel [Ferrimonas balearica]MBY5980244.1 mechanosensitive ion channel [Ferrimonas balearica]MBY6107027.1 mechanosensitive ion channel [Ferrimonas balearica]MBY6224417.1 mechanosensitive ion channel [Ferrimonas balearica]
MGSIESLMDQAPDLLMVYGTRVLLAIVIFIVGRWLAKSVAKGVSKVLVKRQMDQTVVGFVANMVSAVITAFTFIAVLGQLGVQTASLVAVLGAAGLAVGLALQGSLSNFASGVLLVVFRPCKAGDYVEAAGVAGTVEEISIFSTTLVTPDNKRIVAPNSAVMNGVIVNYSAKERRRVDMVVGVSYDADLRQVKEVITDVVTSHELVLKDPEPVIEVLELGASSVDFVVRPWVKTADFWTVRFDLMREIKLRLDQENIGIPYPQMDVHVKALPEQG